MQRIRFGDLDGTGTYTLFVNPSNADLQLSVDFNLEPVIDGTPIYTTSNRDQRIRELIWDSFPNSNSNFLSMVSTLKSYRGLEKQIHLGDVDKENLGWINIRIIDVRDETPRGGDLRTFLSLFFIPTEAI